MKPVLFELFGLKIYGYGAMIALGILAAVILLDKRSKKRGYNEDHIFNMAIVGIIGGILGGKLLYIIVDIKNIIDNPEILKDLGNGFVIYGAIIGGAISVYLYCKKKNWDVLKMLDLVVPSVALAQGFGRIGCFLAGCCYGKPTKLPIGVMFTNSPFAPSNIHLHPTQIYSSIFDFLLAFFLLWYSRKAEKSGRVFSLYVIIYGVGRVIVEFLRGDPRGNVSMLSTSQFISLFTIIIGIFVFNIDRFRKQ
ncbi:prolipoprotein diacylglyceryl transferase [Clostridium tetani]|uniref:Phosphatidylglycerol--prolipoprotein diacylglyceryl transferase n=1 Tax=Clostridium tetani (strain Massachusetts / E88) TaxID=212717 RepID=LGT_CLOTE|nr:prolipoprotein diacylglyceryl transferase [Clostridium tetani]Q899D2.1 RecName: Full=Phosphatidylglycerol--prolipoprotein diacylglyceryl transferase [Clostridium tetani E88]AAO34897.1 prolipoprotein diacylglyceryl transferase [Clostridium tetani E88]AVP55432.1 prolipoprotein diacylglyceryl transferase [Clostridium tetani]KGI36430.1 diacylglyceryl transferase [Clostridium tetani]KGI37271.1 diacylglyceryl transferase [Clostridium tetani ATCC 9441]KGI44623.1 diacylglyceryl transferase [Clostr